jgi:succinate dehydrogenase hydrophobic anchor subunit
MNTNQSETRSPNVYRFRMATQMISAIFLILMIFLLLQSISQINEYKIQELIIRISLFSIFSIVAGCLCLLSFTSAITLTTDEISYKNFFVRKSIPFVKIKGRRTKIVWARYGSSRKYVVESTDKKIRSIQFDAYFDLDKEFWDWFYSLHDLDEKDREKNLRLF